MAAKKLNKITRVDYAHDADEIDAWLVIAGEASMEAVRGGKSKLLAQFDTEEEADAYIAEA